MTNILSMLLGGGGGLQAQLPTAPRQGQISRGPDGKTYQYAQTSGMMGDQGGWGWIEVAPGAGMQNMLRNNSEALTKAGLGLLSGQNAQQQAALGAAGFTGAKKEAQQKNATLAYLQRANPELAQMYEQGLIDNKALGQYFIQAQMPQKPDYSHLKTVDGRLYDAREGKYVPLPDGQAAGVDEDAFKRTRDVRNDYFKDADVKTYGDVRNAYERVRASAQQNSGPGDIGLIFNYMKMLDPASVVREGEFATAESAGGVGQQIRNLYNKTLTGERLTPEVRNQLVSLAESLYNETASNLGDVNARYSRVGEDWQVDTDRFLMSPEQYPPLQPGETREVPTSGGKITIERMPDS